MERLKANPNLANFGFKPSITADRPPVQITIQQDGAIRNSMGETMSPREILEKRIIEGNYPLSHKSTKKVPLNRGNLGDRPETARHELYHVRLALYENYPFSLVSVKREGNSLGRTLFPFSMPDEGGALVAVGGIVHGAGYGSDQMQAFYRMLRPSSESYITNKDIDDAWNRVEAITSQAANILGKDTNQDLREAEILAYLGEADMQTYSQIKDRAIFEEQVKSLELDGLLAEVTSGIIKEEHYYDLPDHFIATVTYGPGVSTIEEYQDGNLLSWVCVCCHSRDGNHSSECLVNNDRWQERFQKHFGAPLEQKNPFVDETNINDEESILVFAGPAVKTEAKSATFINKADSKNETIFSLN